MIPKIIHYCWFGRNPLPAQAKKCISSWRKYCPDYQIIEWNEDNFDVNANLYTRQAYENRKWAFVTDVVRLHALAEYGGIYMDTDVEVIKPLDHFITEKGFSGFEDEEKIPTGIMAAEKDHPLIRKLLAYYEDRPFVVNGEPDLTTNVEIITGMLLKEGFVGNDRYQVIDDFAFYPHDVFCPKEIGSMKIHLTPNSHTIHHFAGSWMPEEKQKLKRYKLRKLKIENLFGIRAASIYESFYFARKANGGDGLMPYFTRILRKRFSRK